MTEIKYKDTTIPVEAGQTVTLNTAGKKLTGDISVEFDTNGSFSYKGNTVNAEKGKVVTLLCAGKKFATDVVVAVEKAEDDVTLEGTWVFKNTDIVGYDDTNSYNIGPIDAECSAEGYTVKTDGQKAYILVNKKGMAYVTQIFKDSNGNVVSPWFYHYSSSSQKQWWYSISNSNKTPVDNVTLKINTPISQIANGDILLAWLKANATNRGAASLIRFSINDISYLAEEGTTWSKWCDSSDNTGGYYVDGTYVRDKDLSGYYLIDVLPTDLIISGHQYYNTTDPSPGGGSN